MTPTQRTIRGLKSAAMNAQAARSGQKRTDLAGLLLAQMRFVGLPEPTREHRFHPERRWRFDFAWPERWLAVEVEGGARAAKIKLRDGREITGHHVHWQGFENDCRKYTEAAILGWRVLRFTTAQINSGEALETIERALQ